MSHGQNHTACPPVPNPLTKLLWRYDLIQICRHVACCKKRLPTPGLWLFSPRVRVRVRVEVSLPLGALRSVWFLYGNHTVWNSHVWLCDLPSWPCHLNEIVVHKSDKSAWLWLALCLCTQHTRSWWPADHSLCSVWSPSIFGWLAGNWLTMTSMWASWGLHSSWPPSCWVWAPASLRCTILLAV